MILPFLPYVLLTIAIILGWRFHKGGIVLTASILGLSYSVFANSAMVSTAKGTVGPSVAELTTFLLPLNLAYFAWLTKRRLLTRTGLFCLGLVVIQACAVTLLSDPSDSPLPQLGLKIKALSPDISKILAGFSLNLRAVLHSGSFFGLKHYSSLSLLAFFGALTYLIIHFKRNCDALSAGFLGTLVAGFLGAAQHPPGAFPMIFFSTTGLILIATTIESSFSMAYMDDLTQLPGRRSFNEALLNLGKRYAIGMIDIDHFKAVNDNYGHKTGDQVLKMVAAKLKDLTGGAKVFRYGGEEFAAIFPGKKVKEVLPHLDVYRKIIAFTSFIVRGMGRWLSSAQTRGSKKGANEKRLRVTVSIGIAASEKGLTSPEEVTKAADAMLYEAKKKGRNRVVG
jgi:diguanylate cyclase (GGDEF)-like protein